MVRKKYDVGGLAFIATLHSVQAMANPRIAVNWLQKVGAYFAEKLAAEERYKSWEELERSILKYKSNYAKLEGPPSKVEKGFVTLPRCPFQESLMMWKAKMGDLPKEFADIVAEYENSGEAAVSPLCVIHQNYRRLCTQFISVNGKTVEFDFLACKSPLSGKIRYHERNIRRLAISSAQVEALMKDNMCCYHLAPQTGTSTA